MPSIDLTGIIIDEITWGILFIFLGILSTKAVKAIQHILGFSAIIAIILPTMIALAQMRNGTFQNSDIGNYILFIFFSFFNTLLGNVIGGFVMPIFESIYDFFRDLRG